MEDSLAWAKEERNQLQAVHDSEIDAGRHTGMTTAGTFSSSPRLSSLVHAFDKSAQHIKASVFDDKYGQRSPSASLRRGASRDHEPSMAAVYQRRIHDLERELEAAQAQLRKRQRTEQQLTSVSSQLVDLHGEIDTLQLALVLPTLEDQMSILTVKSDSVSSDHPQHTRNHNY